MRRSLLKDNAPLFESLVRVLDPLLVAAAGLAAYRIYLENWDLPERYILGLVGMTVCCALLFPFLELYRPQRGTSMFDEVRLLGRAWLLMAAAWFAFLFLTKSGIEFSRVWSTYWFLFGFVSQFVFRIAIRLVLRRLRRHGYNLRHIVIVGAGTLGQEIVTRLGQAAWSGFVVQALYDDDPALIGTRIDGVPVLGPAHQVLRDLEEDSVDQVWLALPLRAEFRIREILAGLQQHAVQVRFVPDIFNFTLLRHTFSEIAGLPVVNLTDSPLKGGNLVVKSIEDMALSALILVIASPLLLLIAALVKLSSPGPVFYVQERITWNGERFRMLKFRTMPVGAEAGAVPVWARPGETRATRVGAILRRFSLDEVPQFINVLRGEMSIVGPRPERPEFVGRFRQEIPGYMQKHLVKAGITGWAQVNDLRGSTPLQERIKFDLYYIENWSLWFDLRIIALTLLHVLRSRNAY